MNESGIKAKAVEKYSIKTIAVLYLLKGTNRLEPLSQYSISKLASVSKRSVRRIVNALRLDGWPILSDNDGYWIERHEGHIEDWMIKELYSIEEKLYMLREVCPNSLGIRELILDLLFAYTEFEDTHEGY